MTYGWIASVAEADTYFLTERLRTSAWDVLTEDEKKKDLNNSYNRILHDDRLNIPSSPTAAQLVALKIGQLEYGYYLV